MKGRKGDNSQSLILIVDDNKNDLQILGNILRANRYKIAAVANGADALEFVNKKNPDLIILDIMLPDIDGYQICRKIKSSKATKDIPVIFISALRETDNKLRGFEIGGVDYITKPFEQNEVLARVNAHLTIYNQSREVNKLNDKLSEMNKTKDKFFSIIAHDLKNPLGAFRNVTGFLLKNFEGLDEEEKLDFLNLMNESAEHIYALLENLLQWSRSQTGRIDFNPEVFGLKMLTDENISLIKMNSDKKGVKLINNIDEGAKVFADPNMISTILRNLITNAVKFTNKQGKVSVESEENGEFITIIVSDTGVGMSEDIKNKLFNIKAGHTTKGTNQESGTGLGLILCKEFVEKNGGEIWVDSAEGKGSQFKFTLPKNKLEIY